MFGLGTTELIIILVIVVLVFGASRLPGLGKGLGDGLKSFKKALTSDDDEEGSAQDEQKVLKKTDEAPAGDDNA